MRLIRDYNTRVELRDADDGGVPDIVGIAAPFYRVDDPGTEYTLWDGAVERIMPGAFDASLADQDDVLATYNHNVNNLLGRSRSSTLSLEKTDAGLMYRIRSKDTPAYRELVTDIERGDVYGSSFTFSVRASGSEWTKQDELDVRELHSVKLWELGPVVSPAYESSSSGLRNADQSAEARDSWRSWLEETHQRYRLQLELAKARIIV